MVRTFGLQENNWVAELYKKRNMWSPAHNHGNFHYARANQNETSPIARGKRKT